MDKYEVAQILREIGLMVELTDENPKKGLAYRKAAWTVENIDHLQAEVDADNLVSYPGIGSHLSRMISTLVRTGTLHYYDELKAKIPPSLLDLTHVPGLTVSKIRVLYENFQVTNLEELYQLFKKETKIKGFGPAFVYKMLRRMAILKTEGPSLLYPQALHLAEILSTVLHNQVEKIEIVGALRRKLELIHEIDLIAISNAPALCIQTLSKHGWTKQVLKVTENSVSVLLKQGIMATLHFVCLKDYFFHLTFLTGSNKHLKSLTKQALEMGFQSLEEALKNSKTKCEEDVYHALQLPYIVPEIREGYGEVEAAKKNKLPNLIVERDLKGIFHCHTKASDGTNTLEELILEGKKSGWEYIGISDHSKSSYQAGGLNEEQLLSQVNSIRELNRQGSTFQLFAGIECDILKDGQLDFSDEILKELDFVIVSIHRYFNMEEEEMTNRLLKAIENPYVTIIGHLTGRLLRHREPYKLNVPKIIDACIANDKIIEINAFPSRLDMDWRYWIEAKDRGLKCSINPDAHSLWEFQNCQYGINVARKGWLEKKDVINTMSLDEIQKYLKKRSSASKDRPS